jgi:hypothetical protein
VASLTATSKAALKTERTDPDVGQARLADLLGDKSSSELLAAPSIMTLTISPIMLWKRIKVCVRPIRDDNEREDLSPIMTHAARGSPSLMTSATMPIYV